MIGEAGFVENVVQQVISEELSTGTSSMSIEHSEEADRRPVFALLGAWLGYKVVDCNAVFVGLPH
jgi:hypothetical protein